MRNWLSYSWLSATVVAIVIMLVVVLGVWLASVQPVRAATEHCPDGWTEKVQATADELDDVVLDEGVLFCVKAANEAGTVLTADGETPLIEYVTWLNNGGQTPSVSYYVIYDDPTSVPPSSIPPTETPGRSVTVIGINPTPPTTSTELTPTSSNLSPFILVVLAILIFAITTLALTDRRRQS